MAWPDPSDFHHPLRHGQEPGPANRRFAYEGAKDEVMKTVILAVATLFMMMSTAWALPRGDTAETWIGDEYDSWWNEHRSPVLQLWERHSYQPEDSSSCLTVGLVWYCPTNSLAQQN